MEWLTNFALASHLGGDTALAVAIGGLFTWFDGVANKDRKDEIRRFLKSPSDGKKTLNSGEIVLSLFELFFAKRHFTLKCFIRSATATALQLIVFEVIYGILDAKVTEKLSVNEIFSFYINAFFASLVPDFLSLYKGRLILGFLSRRTNFFFVPVAITLDVVLSYIFSLVFLSIFFIFYEIFHPGALVMPSKADFAIDLRHLPMFPVMSILILSWSSTLLTSIWTILVGSGAVILRLLVSVKYLAKFTNYVFDVDAAPIASIGRVVALIVWIGSVVVEHI